ncbi:MAG: PLP-dependent transferase [Lachnospiraceae bacterium]|nr:PLP-dependent transferase [Lachnospiraceae bacterium]
MSKESRFNTRLIHGGEPFVSEAREVIVPIFTTATFKQKSFTDFSGYGYARGQNPTREALERLFADLSDAKTGFAFGSGMAAVDAALHVFNSGDTVLILGNIYGGTDGLFRAVYSRFGIQGKEIIAEDNGEKGGYNREVIRALKESITPDVKGIFFETPSNPTLSVLDIREIADIAKENGLITIVDNTFSSPYLQKPLNLGIDIVVESATKYLGGHSDVILGLAATNDDGLAERISAAQHLAGGIAAPFDSYQVIRSIKTLSVRMDRQVENAEKLAEFLDENEAVDLVHYPGLKNDPGYEIQHKQAKNGGAMISFLLNEAYDVGSFLDSLKVFTQGASLGGVESLVGHSATTSHRNVPIEQKERLGVLDNLIRVSVGIEDYEDLKDDIIQALAKARK